MKRTAFWEVTSQQYARQTAQVVTVKRTAFWEVTCQQYARQTAQVVTVKRTAFWEVTCHEIVLFITAATILNFRQLALKKKPMI
jgi:hypothetical protein